MFRVRVRVRMRTRVGVGVRMRVRGHDIANKMFISGLGLKLGLG